MIASRWTLLCLAFGAGTFAGAGLEMGAGCAARCPDVEGYGGPPPAPASFVVVEAFDERLLGADVVVEPNPEEPERGRLVRIQYTLQGEPVEVLYRW
jgi:hypothetical protein